MTRPAYVQLAVRVPKDMKAELERVAALERAHVSELIRDVLAEGLRLRAATKHDQGSSE